MPASNPSYAINTSVGSVAELKTLPTNSLKSGDTAYVKDQFQLAPVLIPLPAPGLTRRVYLWEDDATDVEIPNIIVAPVVGGVPSAIGRWYRLEIVLN